MNCGWRWLELGNYTAALTNFSEAIRLNPTNAITYTGLGLVQEAMRQPAAALKSFRTSEQLDPEWTYGWYHIYLLRVQLDDRAAAEKELASHLQALIGVQANDWPAKVGVFLAGNLPERDFF